MSKQSEHGKLLKFFTYTILSVMIAGFVSWAGANLTQVSLNKSDIRYNKDNIQKLESELIEQRKEIKQMHWVLITAPKVKIPENLK